MKKNPMSMKVLVDGIILLFIGTCFIPMITQGIPYKSLPQCKGNPPVPPVIWTENFLDFCIQVPQNPEGDQIYYMIDWGDGTSSGWIGPYNPGETISISHVWTVEGAYQIIVQAKNQDGISNPAIYRLDLSSNFKFFYVTLGYVTLTYFITIHVESGLYYLFDWGDGNTSDWLGPLDPVMANHVWNFPGEYLFRWKAKDMNGSETPWSSVMIKIGSLLPQPVLEIGTITGGFGTKVQIKNRGTANATNVSVTINFSGAWMILPLLEHYQTAFDLGAGLSENVTVIVFGLGKTTLIVDATCAEGSSATKTATGTVFLFFMFKVK
jgi:hypothetical protein